MEISKFKEIKQIYDFEVELQSRELNLGLRETTMIVRKNLYRRAVLVKVLSEFQSFLAKSCKISQILFFR